MEPRSLGDIWLDINKVLDDSVVFRVRDTETLEDYLIGTIVTWVGVVPLHMEASKCDEWTFNKYMLECNKRKYALLSSNREIEWMKSASSNFLISKVKSYYRRR
jgi:hypothetical protein